MTIFAKARPAEILRAAQKDEIIRNHIRSGVSDVIFKASGSRMYLKYHEYIPPLVDSLYAITTTLSGLQTLGEEYTAIVQVLSGLKEIPPVARRIFMITLQAGGNLLIIILLKFLKESIKKNGSVRSEAKQSIFEFLDVFENVLPFVQLSHKTFFYFTGTFYDISKRLTGIHYVLIHHWLRENQPLYGFKILGFAAVLHLLLRAIYSTKQWWHIRQKSKVAEPAVLQETYSVIKYKCPLCVEDLRQPSVTPCGHLYCWNCVLDWLQANQRCPVCRVHVVPSRVIPLRN